VQVHRTGSGTARLTFARLAWPGYTASIDGRPVDVRQGPAGLLQVDVPADLRDGTLTLDWAPPGQKISLAAAGLGIAATILLLGAELVRRRRRTVPSVDEGDIQRSGAYADDRTTDRTTAVTGRPHSTREH
jgi:hypothetical protein